MLDLVFILVLTLVSAGVGLRLLRAFGETPEQRADALGLAIPLGLGTLGLVTFGLGEAGALAVFAIAVALAAAACVAWRELPPLRHALSRPSATAFEREATGNRER